MKYNNIIVTKGGLIIGFLDPCMGSTVLYTAGPGREVGREGGASHGISHLIPHKKSQLACTEAYTFTDLDTVRDKPV